MATPDLIPARPINKRIVYVKIVFNNLKGVNTLQEQFTGDIYIRAKWREPQLNKNPKDNKPIDFSKYWDPNISIQNEVAETKSKTWKDTWTNKSGELFIREHRNISGTFSERLELHSFPFDHQDLTIALTSTLPAAELDIVEDEHSQSKLGLNCFLFKQEFYYQKFVEFVPRVICKDYSEGCKVGESYPALNMSVVAVRKYGFFVYNIIILMTLISSFPITTFAINMNNPQRRMLLGFILALTGVAFRFMANQNIPKIPYQTLLDRYLFASMAYNYLVAIWHIVVSRYDDIGDEQIQMDLGAFIGSVVLYVLIQIVFFIIVIVKIFKRRRYVEEKEKQYKIRHSLEPVPVQPSKGIGRIDTEKAKLE